VGGQPVFPRDNGTAPIRRERQHSSHRLNRAGDEGVLGGVDLGGLLAQGGGVAGTAPAAGDDADLDHVSPS
jgi:hypothetical protein